MKRSVVEFLAAACCLFGIALGASAVTPKDFGAAGNVVTLRRCGITAGTATLMCPGADFASGDIGKAIVISTAGTTASPQNNALVTTIAGFMNATTVRLAANAANTAANALAYYGTDDTAAIRSCINAGTLAGGRCTVNDGVTFMVSNTASTMNISGPSFIPGGMIDGTGTIVFAPTGALIEGINDRLFFLISTEVTNGGALMSQIKAGSISKGAMSFAAQNAADAAILKAGDFVLVTERDAFPMAGSIPGEVYADWMQVAGVTSGTTVNVITPFRMAFPNARAWDPSCDADTPGFCGLGFRAVRYLVSSVTIRDIQIIIPQIAGPNKAEGAGLPQATSINKAGGIVLRDTRGVTIENVTCESGTNCLATQFDQGSVIRGNHFNQAVDTEVAAAVDFTIMGNVFNQIGSALMGNVTPQSAGFLLDFGAGFGSFTGNVIGASFNAGFTGNWGVHDTTISANTIGWVFSNPATGLAILGGYRNVITGNTLSGGGNGGRAGGVTLSDTGSLQVNMNSDGNIVWNNSVDGFVTFNYSCAGSLGTDNCSGPAQTGLTLKSVTQASLPNSVQNGTIIYCSDCAVTSFCTAGGSGAIAKRINGAWVCN